MIAPNSIVSRKTIDPVATSTRRIARGYAPASGVPCGRRSADQRKCTESVSPPSSSPDRPPPKRLPVGSAFNLRRSVLGAIRNLAAISTLRQAPCRRNSSQIARFVFRARGGSSRVNAGRGFASRIGSTQKRTEAGSPSSDLPTDRRRSDCRSEGHQPQALRPRCNWETTGRSTAPSSDVETRNTLFATFPLQRAHTCVESHMLYLNRTKDSPSRVRFRPLPRLTFRFRVRPFGRASS